MENKKGIFQSQLSNLPQNKEASKIETSVKHPHQQNSSVDHLQRNVQYGLKQPNYLVNPNFQNLQYENQYKVYQSPENLNSMNVRPHALHVQNYVQYEKNAQSQLHRPTQVPPQSSLANNIIVQNTPQIWIPQKPLTIPYQPQPEYQKTNAVSTQHIQGKSNTEKKKLIGSSQLKSPSAKRPAEAAVTKQGWLHKQGSEGLMLWKKRWFVLVEYCLFYYKGPEEEKLLGSILLPSYKVSICKPEEKIGKKYAFKCEHANMRTYILATDSQEQLIHWVQVLNLATVMQKHAELSKPSSNYIPQKQQVIDNYESNEQYSKNTMNLVTPVNTHSPSNSLLQEQCSYNQPLYANAPPKPRRLNDGFSSPSPDILERQSAHYIEPRNLSKSPNPTYCKNFNYHSKHSRESLDEFQRIHDVERRTPETYGRSKLDNRPTDYEDIYAEETMYKRPLSPVAYSHIIKRNNPSPVYPSHRYTPVNMIGPADIMQYPPPQMRKIPSINIARPHSADFLEYELNHKLHESTNIQQRPRPKSSLDININANDNDFYSKERYAEKMRKSAQYLKYVPPKYASNETQLCTGYENISPFVVPHSHFLNSNKSQMSFIQKPQPVRSKSALSESKSIGANSERRYLERDLVSPDFSKQYHNSRYRNQDYDQFTRSASARLANQGDRILAENSTVYRDGERKREESMRRLLEWKQRMLQSPLNRKIQGNIACRGKTDIYNNNDMGYKLSKSPKYSEAYFDDFHSKTSNQYNSYSSDDEENKKSIKNIVQSQAGRTLDTFAGNCESPTPAQPFSTTVLSTSTDPAKPTFHLNLHDTPYSNVIEKLLVSTYQDGSQRGIMTFTKKDLDQLSNLSSELANQIATSIANSDHQNSMSEIDNENIVLEENYIPMSPSKKCLGMSNSFDNGNETLKSNPKMDENHYVEMTQNVVGSFLSYNLNSKPSEESPDVIILNEDKLEPLYMELRSPGQTNEDAFPDIFVKPEVIMATKSDSSDADDEASKNLDSLDTPSQPRFSLSDTFRPASYYLGTSQSNADLQDSSDSELVSPPTIPSSPPPLDDIHSVSECAYLNEKLKDEDTSDSNKLTTNTDSSIKTYSKKESRSIDRSSPLISNPVYKYNRKNCDTEDTSRSLEIQMGLDQNDINEEFQNDTVTATPNQENPYAYENFANSYIDSNKEIIEEDLSELELQEIVVPECSTTTTAECINDSLPIITSNSFSANSAPYYYSDLSMAMTASQSSLLTLNNQRSTLKCKRDITHIRNPIKDILTTDDNTTLKLAAEARSASVDFLNLTDKPGHIDNKNIYESNSIHRASKDNNSGFPARNLLSLTHNNKFTSVDSISTDVTVRRTHSLEGLLENVLKDGSMTSLLVEHKDDGTKSLENASEGSYLWEEDSIWRERLRLASQRHTKSMEELDILDEGDLKRKFKSPRGITRGVTYVNENYMKLDKLQSVPKSSKTTKGGDNRIKKDGSFTLDREKLRQWDLMSSAPSDNQLSTTVASQVQEGNNIVVEISDANFDPNEIVRDQQTASGSISINPRDASQLSTFPRTMSAQKAWIPTNSPMESHSITNLSRNYEKDFSSPNPRIYYSNHSTSHPNLTPSRQENWPNNEKVSVCAGELLGRTHEELVLLLIQLRRQSSQTLQAIEICYNEFDMIQAQLYAMDQTRRMENLQKLEQIKQHLLELEKQYEKGKPLVNLVDNMVKLGSLYRVPQERNNISHHIKDRIEFNQQIQERRLLAEEKREWNRLNSSHLQFQEKVRQLYMLDRLIHEESGTLQNLQQDKEDIERALGGLRYRLSKGFKDPSEIELARKQQIMLENELIRVHFMLAQNSKKLEETVSGNAKLEQELMVLKQKLKNSTPQNLPQYPNSGDTMTCTGGNSSELESDLHKVKKKIGELQQQRHKLSLQVRQLTDRSSNLSQPKFPSNDIENNSMNKKRIQSLWRETDLDTMSITDHGDYDSNSPRIKSSPLYINTNNKYEDYDFYQDNNSNNSMTDNSFTNSNTPQEKQEIKTVRIVKRESEKRQRDREKSIPPGKWDAVQEEDSPSENCNILFKPPPSQIGQSTPSLFSSSEDVNELMANNSVSSPNLCEFEERPESNLEKPHDISTVFKSETARQIITEMAIKQTPKQTNRRSVPKEKRRHYTAPHDQLILKSMQQLPTDMDTFDKDGVHSRRARDDLDMERALRQRIDAPDVVRSTLINTELKYNERTIDDLLGTPSKINIPERYIPEQLPQLSLEEQEYRLKKVETIKKMLSDTTFISTSSTNLSGEGQEIAKTPTIVNNATTKILDEKKQREHLLQLNQILAKQVMEMSKIVAEKATARLSNKREQISAEEEDLSPLTPLPLYQQRDNFYT